METVDSLAYRLGYKNQMLKSKIRDMETDHKIQIMNWAAEPGEIAVDVMVPCINRKFPTRVYFDEHDYRTTKPEDMEIGMILHAMCCGCMYDDITLSEYGKQKILRAVIEYREEQADILNQHTAEMRLAA